MKKKLLLVEPNLELRDFLKERFSEMGIDVLLSQDGVDSMVKLKDFLPDLVIISHQLPGDSQTGFLKSKKLFHTAADTPVFMLTGKISKDEIEEYTALSVTKIFPRPLMIDVLFKEVSTVLNTQTNIDTTPSIVEAHLNEGILYVEIGLGYNAEKIRLLELKIHELLDLYQVKVPKIILLLPETEINADNLKKLESVLNLLLETVHGRVGWIKILSLSGKTKEVIKNFPRMGEIEVFSSIDKALDSITTTHNEKDNLEELIFSKNSGNTDQASVSLRFKEPKLPDRLTHPPTIAVVDDDFIVQEIVRNTLENTKADVQLFDDGPSFLKNLDDETDLIFLDIMMPGMTGFDVLGHLKDRGKTIPVIILSALSRKETVEKAMGFGVRSYLIKPLKPGDILRKTQEVLASQI